MISSNRPRNLFTALPVLLFALAIGVAPSCSSTEEEATADTPQEEVLDEADFDPSDGAG